MAFTNVGSDEDVYVNSSDSSHTASVAVPDLAANSIGFVAVNILVNGAARTITGVTWNGDAMTQGVTILSGVRSTDIWYLANPDDNGTYNIIVTYSAGLVSGSVSIVTGWADAGAAVTKDDDSTDSGTNDPITITSTQAGANELVVSSSGHSANALADPTVSGCTGLQSWDQGGNCTITAYSIPAGSGDATHTHDYSQSEAYVIASMSFKEATSGAVNITAAENTQAQVSDAASLTFTGPTYNVTAAEANQAQASDAASITAAGPTYPITAADDNQAQVSDAATLDVIHPITAAEGNQAQASDAASLTANGPIYNITAAENNQAQVSDAATLGVIHVISPAEGNQAQVSDAANLAEGEYSVTPSQQNQAQVSDAATLGVYTPVSPSQQNQAQTSDAASITFSGIDLVSITAAQNNQAQTSDAVSISAYYPVAPSQQNQAQTSDAVSISANGPEYAVTVADATQAQVSDAAILGVYYPITAAGNNQAQVSDLAVISTGAAVLHGARKLYQVNTRATNYVDTRPTHKVNTRETHEVDD